MKKITVFILIFFITVIIYAQSGDIPGNANHGGTVSEGVNLSGAYLIPRQIFVGDRAVFVLPLPPASQNNSDIIISSPSMNLPNDPNIDFHQITLQKRTTGSRLMIEFTSFKPGELELPLIEIGGEYFSELKITVNSIITERTSPVLSAPATSLAMPGTAFMFYGTLFIVIFAVLFMIWFFIKGNIVLNELYKKWKRFRLFADMRKTEKNLRKAILKGENLRIILDKISMDFRIFLSVLTNINCRSMTAKEFKNLPADFIQYGDFLTSFFCGCDDLRFSGGNVDSQEIIRLLDDLNSFIDTTENAKNEKTQEMTA